MNGGGWPVERAKRMIWVLYRRWKSKRLNTRSWMQMHCSLSTVGLYGVGVGVDIG